MEKTYADSWLKLEEGLGGARPVLQGTTEEVRGQFSGLGAMLEPQYPTQTDAVSTEDGTIGSMKYRAYTPVGPSCLNKSLPLGVYYHPGGFVLGWSLADDVLCRALAEKTGSIIVAVQYRLSPENKAPAHLEDALEGFQWAHQNATRLGADPTKMYVMGASAGAALALSVTRKVSLQQTKVDTKAVKGVVALGPPTLHSKNIPEVYRSAHTSFSQNKENVPILSMVLMDGFFAGAGIQPDNKDYFSALDRESHKLFPPTYMVTCEFDPLRDDGKVMAESLKTSGVDVKTEHYDGLPHCFWLCPSLPETEVFMKNTVEGMKWLINKM